jgi:hypothetical protein
MAIVKISFCFYVVVMVQKLKLCRIGNSVGVVLPKEALPQPSGRLVADRAGQVARATLP